MRRSGRTPKKVGRFDPTPASFLEQQLCQTGDTARETQPGSEEEEDDEEVPKRTKLSRLKSFPALYVKRAERRRAGSPSPVPPGGGGGGGGGGGVWGGAGKLAAAGAAVLLVGLVAVYKPSPAQAKEFIVVLSEEPPHMGWFLLAVMAWVRLQLQRWACATACGLSLRLHHPLLLLPLPLLRR